MHRLNGGGVVAALKQVVPPLGLAALIGAIAIAAVRGVTDDVRAERWMGGAAIVPALLLYVLACRLLVPQRYAEVVELVTTRLRRTGSTTPPG